VFNVNVESESNNNSPKDNPIFDHIADFIIQTLIKEDVNAFAEAKLIHELLVIRLPEVAIKLMRNVVTDASEMIKKDKSIDLVKEIGGINTQKRMHFRSTDQYNSFIWLFFQMVEEQPEFLEPVDSEEMFEKLMIYCIHEFRVKLEEFAIQIAKDRTDLEHKHKLYVHRRNAQVTTEVPTYADFVAERIDDLV
jgi:hypothetical protein